MRNRPGSPAHTGEGLHPYAHGDQRSGLKKSEHLRPDPRRDFSFYREKQNQKREIQLRPLTILKVFSNHHQDLKEHFVFPFFWQLFGGVNGAIQASRILQLLGFGVSSEKTEDRRLLFVHVFSAFFSFQPFANHHKDLMKGFVFVTFLRPLDKTQKSSEMCRGLSQNRHSCSFLGAARVAKLQSLTKDPSCAWPFGNNFPS